MTAIDFKGGERPSISRPDEEFLYKYMQSRPDKEKKAEEVDEDDAEFGGDEDPDMEAFVEGEMQKQMKKMAGGFDADEEDISIDDDGEEGEEEDDDDDDGEEAGFFSGEDDL